MRLLAASQTSCWSTTVVTAASDSGVVPVASRVVLNRMGRRRMSYVVVLTVAARPPLTPSPKVVDATRPSRRYSMPSTMRWTLPPAPLHVVSASAMVAAAPGLHPMKAAARLGRPRAL